MHDTVHYGALQRIAVRLVLALHGALHGALQCMAVHLVLARLRLVHGHVLVPGHVARALQHQALRLGREQGLLQGHRRAKRLLLALVGLPNRVAA